MDDTAALVRAAMFSFGPALIAYGIGANWFVIAGIAIFASSIPGVVSRWMRIKGEQNARWSERQ